MFAKVEYKITDKSKHPTAFERKEEVKSKLAWTNYKFGQIVDVGPPGHTHAVTWAPASGAAKAEISQASIRVGAAAIEAPQLLSTIIGSSQVDITVGSARAVRTLKLNGLKWKNPVNPAAKEIALRNETDLNSQGLKILISTLGPKGDFSPVFTAPEVAAKGVFPASFTGSTYDNDTITFSAPVQSTKLRLQLVKNTFPDDSNAQPILLTSVNGTYLTLPQNLKLTAEDGTVLFSLPGEYSLSSPDSTISLIQPLETQLQKKLDGNLDNNLNNKVPITTALTLSADGDTQAQVLYTGVKGYLVRTFDGVTKTALNGDGVSIKLNAAPPLNSEPPNRATADLEVRYLGVKLLETLSGEVPGNAGNVSGIIVSSNRVVRALAPTVLLGKRVARVGIVGRAPQPCELVLDLLDMTGAIQGPALLKPRVLPIEPSQILTTHWFDIEEDELDTVNIQVGVGVRVNNGRFFWVSLSDTPLVRIAVYDTDPGTEPVKIGGSVLVSGSLLNNPENKFFAAGADLPAEVFAGEAPFLSSNLFVTVDLGDLTLRYAR